MKLEKKIPKKNVATKLEEGGGVRALVAGQLKKYLFCGFLKNVVLLLVFLWAFFPKKLKSSKLCANLIVSVKCRMFWKFDWIGEGHRSQIARN